MPKVDMDYSNTIIYKIVCKDINIKEIYVGHTTNFTKRKYSHKLNCNSINNKKYNIYVYQFIREHNGWDNWDMIEVEKYNAIDKLDASKKERYWIETLQATLNKIIPTRTKQEYYIDNLEKLTEIHKEYREQNKDKMKEYQKEHYKKNKEQKKEYREQNKDKMKEYLKIYNEKNKEEINAKKREYSKKKYMEQKELKLIAIKDI